MMSERARIKLDQALKVLDVPLKSSVHEWSTAGQFGESEEALFLGVIKIHPSNDLPIL